MRALLHEVDVTLAGKYESLTDYIGIVLIHLILLHFFRRYTRQILLGGGLIKLRSFHVEATRLASQTCKSA